MTNAEIEHDNAELAADADYQARLAEIRATHLAQGIYADDPWAVAA
jgi:hypothetical protein